MTKDLVIVESPTKARTIAKILGDKYKVEASYGHVRDLPKSKLGVAVEDDFQPEYVIPTASRKTVTKLKELASKANEVYLATDEDREGEAIGWHIQQVLKKADEKIHRVAFHEITPEAIKEAFKHTRKIDLNLVDAQQARRILDRLVGYKLSPLLWRKIFRRLSAGRVQSVALRLLVEREREIEAFDPQEYWTIETQFQTTGSEQLVAEVIKENGQVPTLVVQADADRIVKILENATEHKIVGIKDDMKERHPAAPFTTSTLQQAAGTQLGFGVKRTMTVAQQLYEGVDVGSGQVGLITYMRTDSTSLAMSAVMVARQTIEQMFGGEYLPEKPRFYKTKSKGAQEAHEAIRPTNPALTPDQVRGKLTDEQFKLYKLVWQRMIACQMKSAQIQTKEVIVRSDTVESKANGAIIIFPGFAKVFDRWPFQENKLPVVSNDEILKLLKVSPTQHFTEPPARYTEPSLVKQMEKMGIGRPSTYAPTIVTLGVRGYVKKEKRMLIPQPVGMMVNDFLVEHFPNIVDYNFTARMEDDLDEVAEGKKKWEPVIREFYEPFIKQIQLKDKEVVKQVTEDEATDKVCIKCGKPMVIKTGRFGKFMACSGFPECKYTEPIDGHGKSTVEATDKVCSKCGAPMVKKTGRFGPFYGCSNYPECKNIENINLPTVDMACPKCKEGRVVVRRTKRGKVFWGCGNYPKCDFASWDEPVEQPCPTCGEMMTKPAKKGYPVCTKCGFEEKS
ncbi:MAG: type I DNA topoisomerase [Patescibacteria group bacterium]|jgi:DNA topoisomerase-1